MDSSRFIQCFPTDDGKIACQHHNGSWIVFSAYTRKRVRKKDETSSEEEEVVAQKVA